MLTQAVLLSAHCIPRAVQGLLPVYITEGEKSLELKSHPAPDPGSASHHGPGNFLSMVSLNICPTESTEGHHGCLCGTWEH